MADETAPTALPAAVDAQQDAADAPPVASTSGRQEVPHAAKAWEFFRRMGSPKYHVAPMVDQVRLVFGLRRLQNHGHMHAGWFMQSSCPDAAAMWHLLRAV